LLRGDNRLGQARPVLGLKKSSIFFLVGSSINLKIRLSQYFNVNYLERNSSMRICRALLKHGYSNFSLEILEYCEPAKCLEREKYYINKLKPEYNTSLSPESPFLDLKHSIESREKMRVKSQGRGLREFFFFQKNYS